MIFLLKVEVIALRGIELKTLKMSDEVMEVMLLTEDILTYHR